MGTPLKSQARTFVASRRREEGGTGGRGTALIYFCGLCSEKKVEEGGERRRKFKTKRGRKGEGGGERGEKPDLAPVKRGDKSEKGVRQGSIKKKC